LGDRNGSWRHLLEQLRPSAPENVDERIGLISAKEEEVMVAEPFLEGTEATAASACLALGN
jgi:hypothetical protein